MMTTKAATKTTAGRYRWFSRAGLPLAAAMLGGVALVSGNAGAAEAEAERRPNFLFFLVDDLGWADVGCNRPETFHETPNIDALAASGMRFTNGYAACPVCSPTRASIVTGPASVEP